MMAPSKPTIGVALTGPDVLGAWSVTSIGPHRIAHGDIGLGAVQTLMGAEKADVFYCDPPWGEGTLRYWRTHAGDARKPTWKTFVSYLCIDAASAVVPGGPIWVEMGLQWEADITEGLAAVGIVVTRRWMTSYASPPRPAVLLYAGPSLPADFDPSTLRGADLPRACLAVSGRPGGLVLDPCCGKGFTARAAVSNGMVFRGCELNAARLHVTEQWLRKRTVT